MKHYKNDLVANSNPYTQKRLQGNNSDAKNQKMSDRSNTELNSTVKKDQKSTHKISKQDSKTERNANAGLHHKKKLSQQQSPFKPDSGHKYNHLLNKK